MNLFMELFVQCVATILAIVVIFQVAGKIFIKDSDED